MSVLNTKSGLNSLFPFAKKKPNIPAKLLDKIDTKSNKQKLIEDKNCTVVNTSEQIRCDVLTENNEKTKSVSEVAFNETPKKILETCKTIPIQDDNSGIKSKNKKSVTQKSSSNVPEGCIEEIKKPKESYQRWNIPFSSKFSGKEIDKTLLTMQDLIYYNPVTNPIMKEEKDEQKQDDDPDNDLLSFESIQKPSNSNNCITPLLKVGVDGKIIVDKETLMLSETGLEEKQEELKKSKVIEESAFRSRSYSYKRKKEPSKQWTKDETLKFYKCLMNLGTDFSMMGQYFPSRTRAQIKRKYKTEEKKNPQLINGCLTNTTHYDSVCMENMFQEEESCISEETNVQANLEVNDQPRTRKRRHKDVKRSDCSRMSICAYMFEEEIVLKNKRKQSSKITTLSSLKDQITASQSSKNKEKVCTLSETKSIHKEPLSPKIGKKNEEPKSKVRRLQDFHEEYEENITKYEEGSNSE